MVGAPSQDRYPLAKVGTPRQGRYPPTKVGTPPPAKVVTPPTKVGTPPPGQGSYSPHQSRYPPLQDLLHDARSRRRTFLLRTCFGLIYTVSRLRARADFFLPTSLKAMLKSTDYKEHPLPPSSFFSIFCSLYGGGDPVYKDETAFAG